MEMENLLRAQVTFTKISAQGFNHCRCPICNDYQERMGVIIEYGTIGVNCFNCGFSTKYQELDGYVPKKFRQLLIAFGVDENDIDKSQAVSFISKKNKPEKDITVDILKKINTTTPEIPLPDGAVLLQNAPDSLDKKAIIEYLESRSFKQDSYPWYFIPDFYVDDYLKKRVIIPYYRNGKIIYWQARSISKFVKKRYINCDVPKSAVMFGYDELYSWSSRPLFITEGVFDALSVNGVCLLGSTLSEQALLILNKTKRRIIFVIDKDKNGKALAKQVIENGWEIAFVSDGNADINDSILKCGKIFTVYHLMTNTFKGFMAETMINLKCK